MNTPQEFDRQFRMLNEAQQWLIEEANFAAAMRKGPAQERRLTELHFRNEQIGRDLIRLVERFGGTIRGK